MEFLFKLKHKESFVEKLQKLSCAVMLWEIWKERCRVRYGNKKGRLNNISWRLMVWVKAFSSMLQQIKCKDIKETQILVRLQIPPVEVRCKGNMTVKWLKPSSGFVKLNVDGAAKGNPGFSGGWGIIRNHNGDVIAAFSNFYGYATNMEAEFYAVRDGLRLCTELNLGLHTVIVESDSKVLVEMFK